MCKKGLGLFRHLIFWQESFWHGTFSTWVLLLHRCSGTWIFWQFGNVMTCPWLESPYYCAGWQNVPVSKHQGPDNAWAKMSQCCKVQVPKCPSVILLIPVPKYLRCWNIPAPKSSGSKKINMLKVYVSSHSF